MPRRKQAEEPEEDQTDEESTDEDEVEEEAEEAGAISLDISSDTITIEVPRDDNAGETLQRIGKMVDGL